MIDTVATVCLDDPRVIKYASGYWGLMFATSVHINYQTLPVGIKVRNTSLSVNDAS